MQMNIYGFSCVMLLAVTLSILGADSANAQINLVDRSSFINASDFTFDGNDQLQTINFQGAGTFNESLVNGDIQASQISSIIGGVFDIQTSSQGGNSSVAGGITEGITLFNTEFEVLSASTFTLTGLLTEGQSTGGGGADLSLSGGNLDLNFSSSPSALSVPIDTSGVLLPGIYELDVSTFSLGGSSSLPAGPVSANAVLTITGASVPEPSLLLPAMILAIGGSIRRRRSVS